MNPKFGQQWASYDAGQKNLRGQLPGWNSSVRKLQQLIYKGVIYLWRKNSQQKIIMILIQIVCPNSVTLHVDKQGIHSVKAGALAAVFKKLAKLKLTPKLKLVTVVKGDQKAPFSIATTPRYRGGHYSFPWIAPLYPWYVPYIAEC